MRTVSEVVTKIRKLVEVKVVVEPGYVPRHVQQTEEEKAKFLESWCKNFMEFIRDHRHQDVNAVYVDKTYETQCTGCGHEWEEMTDDEGVVCCAWCGVPIEIVT